MKRRADRPDPLYPRPGAYGLPLPAPGRVDVEEIWPTSVGDNDVDLDDGVAGVATVFKVPEPKGSPPLIVQESVEKLAETVDRRLLEILLELRFYHKWSLRLMVVLVGSLLGMMLALMALIC